VIKAEERVETQNLRKPLKLGYQILNYNYLFTEISECDPIDPILWLYMALGHDVDARRAGVALTLYKVYTGTKLFLIFQNFHS
jgi:hypothetical protein